MFLFRSGKAVRPQTRLPVKKIHPSDGWCDDPAAPSYNRAVKLPLPYGHERLYRDDSVYDIIGIMNHNERPRVRGGGSAIFFHLAKPGMPPTEGCVAIRHSDMRRLLPRLGMTVWMVIP